MKESNKSIWHLREAVYCGKHWESAILAALGYGGVESFDAITVGAT